MPEITTAPETAPEETSPADTETPADASLLFGSIPMDEEMTEEEEQALAAGEQTGTSRFARGCLEVGAVLLVLAGLFMVLESKAHLCFCYTWPPHVLSLSCIAGSMLSLMTGLFALGRNTFAMMVMILSGWTVLLVLATIYLEEPEGIEKPIPGTEHSVVMTLVSTPVSSNLYIDQPVIKGFLSRHWKLPVHDRNQPLDELVELLEQDSGEVYLVFDAKVWAVYDPVKKTWNDVLHHPSDVEYVIPTEPTEVHKSFTVK